MSFEMEKAMTLTLQEIECPVCRMWKGKREDEPRGEGKVTRHSPECPLSLTGRAYNNPERFQSYGIARATEFAQQQKGNDHAGSD